MSNMAITDRHLETDTRAKTWNLRDKHFDYSYFLSNTAKTIATSGRHNALTGKLAAIAALVDDYTTRRLFGREIDFTDPENYKVLAYQPIAEHVATTIRNVITELLGQPAYEVRTGVWRKLSNLARIFVREAHSIPARHCIYPRMGISARFGGLERAVMETTLDHSPEVLAWCKLQRKHNLTIAYRDPSGLLRNYEVDFLLRTADSCFILETKGDRDMDQPTVAIKARAARHWCESICAVAAPSGLPQPTQWEYLLLDESTYRANEGASFAALLPLMRASRDRIIASHKAMEDGKLFG
jgi:type III restriction enzyme